jgi:hypothetical protein
MAHPHIEQAMALLVALILDAGEQPGMAACAHLRVAEFAMVRILDLAAQLLGHRLHAVADAQHRHAGIEDDRGRLHRRRLVGRRVAARQDDAARAEAPDEFRRHVAGMDLAVDACLADPARDQLRDLRAEIENQDLLVLHRGRPGRESLLKCRGRRAGRVNRCGSWALP